MDIEAKTVSFYCAVSELGCVAPWTACSRTKINDLHDETGGATRNDLGGVVVDTVTPRAIGTGRGRWSS